MYIQERSKFLCIYIVSMCAYVYIYIYIHTQYVCVYIYIYIYIYIHTHTHTQTQGGDCQRRSSSSVAYAICVHTRNKMPYVCTLEKKTYIYSCIYTYIHAYIHTRTGTTRAKEEAAAALRIACDGSEQNSAELFKCSGISALLQLLSTSTRYVYVHMHVWTL